MAAWHTANSTKQNFRLVPWIYRNESTRQMVLDFGEQNIFLPRDNVVTPEITMNKKAAAFLYFLSRVLRIEKAYKNHPKQAIRQNNPPQMANPNPIQYA